MIPDRHVVDGIIREAAEKEILPRFQRLASHEITKKQAGETVTVADVETERRLSRDLCRLLPGSVVVGEESAAENPDILAGFASGRPVWIIDPVDGTQNFADGKSCFAVIVALYFDGRTQAGWIYDPINDCTIWAQAGEGAWEGEKRLDHAGVPGAIGNMTSSFGYKFRKRIAALQHRGEGNLPRVVARYGSVGIEYMDLARGRLHIGQYAGRLKPWDHAAGVLIHGETGGFSALLGNGAAYAADHHETKANLVLAPDRPSWEEVKRFQPD